MAWRAQLSVIIGTAVAALFLSAGSAHAASWTQIAELGNTPVSSVAISPTNHNDIAAISGANVWLSHDGGLIWFEQSLPSLATSLAFDPVHDGTLLVGMDNSCLQETTDFGVSWHNYLLPNSWSCDVQNVVGTKGGFYFDATNVQNYSTELFLFKDGVITPVNSYPEGVAGVLAYDPGSGQLCSAGWQQIYCSTDNGATWQVVAVANSVGSAISNLAFDEGTLWAETGNGLYEDQGGTWSLVQEGQAYGLTPLRGLVVNHGQPTFGLDAGSNSSVMSITTNIADDGLQQRVNHLAYMDGTLFAATSGGLFVTEDITSSEAKISRPVILIPGIMGSWPEPVGLLSGETQLVLDPITHTYDPILARLRAVGYVDGETLFTLPYDWEQENEDNVPVLEAKIAQAKRVCQCAQVDLVGHSMGGLLARAYIEGSNYQDDVHQLIEVGTPNAGSLNAYYAWEAGLIYNDGSVDGRVQSDLISGALHLQSIADGYKSFKEFVHERIRGLADLLPNYNYIQGRNYPDGYPTNSFLDQLDAPASIALLNQRTTVRVIGSDSDKDTLTQLVVGDPGPGADYPDGRVLDTRTGVGDGTVSFTSLESTGPADSVISGEHGSLTTSGADEIIRYLLGGDADTAYSQSIPNEADLQAAVPQADVLADSATYHMLYVIGSGAASITSGTGGVVSSSTNTIDNSYFSGNGDPAHFFSIPNPDSQTYDIHFDDSSGGPQTVTLGGAVVDGASDFDGLPTAQMTVNLASGQSVDAVYDADDQTITITNLSSIEGDSGQVASGDSTTHVSASSLVTTQPPVSDQVTLAAQTGQQLSSTDGQVVAVAVSPIAATQNIQPIHLAIVADKVRSWQNYGLEFWISVVALVSTVLALAVWRLRIIL